MKGKKVVAYIRVSTEEQATRGYSIEAQQQVLRDYAKGHDLEIVKEFVETHSAYRPKERPVFLQMLAYLRKHPEVRGVLCYKIDRLTRNISDLAELSEMEQIEIISATEALPENATGKLVCGLQAVISRYYSDVLSERVKTSMLAKAKKGLYPSYAPTGYLNDPETGGIIPDPVRAPLVRRLFEKYAKEDISLSELTRWARDIGLTTKKGTYLRKSAIHKMLTNPIYCGDFVWNGVLYRGRHEPLISRELFEQVQARLRGKSSPLTKRHFPYRGILVCGHCGCRITASLIKGKYVYYHCTRGRGPCPQPFVREEELGNRLAVVVDSVHLTKDQVEVLLSLLRERSKQKLDENERLRRHLVAEKERIEQWRVEAYQDKLEGKISEERWLEFERRWSRRLSTIEAELEALENSRGPRLDDAEATFKLLQRAPELYRKQSHEERARLVKALVSNCRMVDGKIEPIYKKPFSLVAEGLKTANWLPGEDSNLQPAG